MGYREVRDMDIREVLRRWEAGDSRRQIAAATGLSRDTVAKYIKLAEKAGLQSASQADERMLALLQGQRQPLVCRQKIKNGQAQAAARQYSCSKPPRRSRRMTRPSTGTRVGLRWQGARWRRL